MYKNNHNQVVVEIKLFDIYIPLLRFSELGIP